MGTCVSKCYSSDPFIHLDSDELKDKLVVSETSPPLPPTSSVSSSSAASVLSPNSSTRSAFLSSSSSSSSSSSFAAPSAESSLKKPLPSTEINPRKEEAESQYDRKHAPLAPRATKQHPLARTSTVPAPSKRTRTCSPAAIAERRSFAGSTRGGAASPPRVPRSRSQVVRKESVRSAASPDRVSSMSRRGMALLNQADRRVFQKGSNSIVGRSVAVEDLDNPLISMDCFIFI